jgi:predicted O-methyltransferase YrrM
MGSRPMSSTYESKDWNTYRMDFANPARALEPPEREIAEVGAALAALQSAGILPHTEYDNEKMLAMREAVHRLFEIPWTAITPRMQRLLYAVNAIVQPQNMIAAGVFCGNTFISNAGAAVGPGACYTARNLIGVEIEAQEAKRAERNVRRIDPTGIARVLAADAIEVVAEFPEPIHLLYLDPDGDPSRSVYLEVLQAAYEKVVPGGLVLAHNSLNGGPQMVPYLEFARDPDNFQVTMNIAIDVEGLEVSRK